MKTDNYRRAKIREIEDKVYSVMTDMRSLAMEMCTDQDVDAIAFTMQETRKLETIIRTLRMRLIPRD